VCVRVYISISRLSVNEFEVEIKSVSIELLFYALRFENEPATQETSILFFETRHQL